MRAPNWAHILLIIPQYRLSPHNIWDDRVSRLLRNGLRLRATGA